MDEVYPIVFIDAVHFSVRDNGQIRKLAAYVILAVSMTGHKEVLSIHIGENESAKYWLGVLNELKNRGVKDVLAICADGLTGMKEAVSAAFPQTELQRCIVHQVRNTLKYVGEKNKKEFANDLKTIYHAPSEDAALEALDRVTEKWEGDYPNAMKSWYKNLATHEIARERMDYAAAEIGVKSWASWRSCTPTGSAEPPDISLIPFRLRSIPAG